MQRGRPKADLLVTPEDQLTLQGFTARRKTAQALALRSRIILQCAQGATNIEVASALGVTNNTVGKWRRRYIERGLAGILEEHRCAAPLKLSVGQVEEVL